MQPSLHQVLVPWWFPGPLTVLLTPSPSEDILKSSSSCPIPREDCHPGDLACQARDGGGPTFPSGMEAPAGTTCTLSCLALGGH